MYKVFYNIHQIYRQRKQLQIHNRVVKIGIALNELVICERGISRQIEFIQYDIGVTV